MKENAPFLIIRNTNLNVREISPYLQLAATYGYTVVILDIDKHLTFEPQVLAATNNRGLNEGYFENRLRQWEDVYPFAMGWCPRPRDAASLLKRYKEIAFHLSAGKSDLELKRVRNTEVFPFCMARVCLFGWDKQDRNYCRSGMVAKAYGSKDTITVFGYAVLGDLVVALVHLTDAQAALAGDSDQTAAANKCAKNGSSPNAAFSNFAGEIDEMRCTLDLNALATPDLGDQALEEGAGYHELPPPSRMSLIILGSTSPHPIVYSEAVRRCFSSLRDAMLSWRGKPASMAKTDVGRVAVCASDSEIGRLFLILDEKTVELDVLFTGYYQSHTTRASGRCHTWSTDVPCIESRCLGTPQRVGGRFAEPSEFYGICQRRIDQLEAVGGAWRTADNTQLLGGIDAPCVNDEETRRFLRTHGRLLFLVRGPHSSRKSTVVTELERQYPLSRAYLPDMSRDMDSTTWRELHELCFNRLEDFMKADAAMIINKNPNFMVWEVSNFLALACKYGYAVIILDFPVQLSSNPRVLGVAVHEEKYDRNATSRVKQWEEVHPFATGWSPRPKDAARLLRRFLQLRAALNKEDQTLVPHDVSCSKVFPFCLARLCRFGRTREDKDYCKSEKVRKAYGRSDTLRVFGYAVVRGYVFALVELSDEQSTLARADGGATDTGDVDALSRHFEVGLSPQSWDEVSCIIDLFKFLPEEGGSDQKVGNTINLSDFNPSRVTFMPLCSLESTKYSYSEAAATAWPLLSSTLHYWAARLALGVDRVRRAAGIYIYGSASPTGGALLLIDTATVELDVVFTGYYHPHTTPLSGRSSRWSSGVRFSPPERGPRRQEKPGGAPEGPLSWRKAQR